MECTLAALVACFSWSNLYIDTGLLAQDKGEIFTREVVTTTTTNSTMKGTPSTTSTGTYSLVREDTRKNPYGRLALGYEVTFDDLAGLGEVTLRAEAAHESSIVTTSDRGVNSIGLYARWRPFAK